MINKTNSCDCKLKIVVIGLPRSGTSFLTNLISTMGFDLGKKDWLKVGNEHNLDGYFECVPLNAITNKILSDLRCDFHHNLPDIIDINNINISKYKNEIYKLASDSGVEIYKDNKLTIMPDVYDNIFTNINWVYIERDVADTYKSRFGNYISFNDWVDITNRRKKLWLDSSVSDKALKLNYNQLGKDLGHYIDVLSEYLNIKISDELKSECLSVFRPCTALDALGS